MCGLFSSLLTRSMALMFCMAGVLNVSPGVDIEFSQGSYSAGPGDNLELVVSFSEPVPAGIEGYALLLNFPKDILSVTGIDVVPDLDWDLFDAGAIRDASDSFASVAGFVEFGEPAYTGTDFVTFNLIVTNAAAVGTYSLQLSPLLAEGANFVDGNGDPIDSIAFGSATLEIVEPLPTEFLADLRIDIIGTDVLLRFTGTSGRSYKVQYSSSLEGDSWQDLGTYTAAAGGVVEAVDSGSPLQQTRFYRVVDP